jgi:Domain of unknown function (DUF4349)
MSAPEATLEAIDAALAEGRVTDPQEAQIQELALALRAESPHPSDAFGERLDVRVSAGFPRKRLLGLPSLPPVALLGSAAAAVVAVVVAVSLLGHGNASAPRGAKLAPESVAGDRAAASSGVAVQTAPQALPAIPVRQHPRHVERSASLTLAATRDKLETVGNEIVAVVDRHRGYVLHSSVTSGSGGGGSFDLRVPVGQLQGTLADLSKLADVRSRSQNVNDVTSSYNATQDRLATQQALRQSLLKQLAAATTDSQTRALRSRLRLVSAEIRSLSARFDNLRQHTSFASIAVSLVPKRAHPVINEGGIAGDFHDSLRSLVDSFGIALRVLGVAIPIGIVAGLGWFGFAVLQRRRREAALF